MVWKSRQVSVEKCLAPQPLSVFWDFKISSVAALSVCKLFLCSSYLPSVCRDFPKAVIKNDIPNMPLTPQVQITAEEIVPSEDCGHWGKTNIYDYI